MRDVGAAQFRESPGRLDQPLEQFRSGGGLSSGVLGWMSAESGGGGGAATRHPPREQPQPERRRDRPTTKGGHWQTGAVGFLLPNTSWNEADTPRVVECLATRNRPHCSREVTVRLLGGHTTEYVTDDAHLRKMCDFLARFWREHGGEEDFRRGVHAGLEQMAANETRDASRGGAWIHAVVSAEQLWDRFFTRDQLHHGRVIPEVPAYLAQPPVE